MPRSVTVTRRQFGYFVSPGTFTVDKEIGLAEEFVLRNRSKLTVIVEFPPGAVYKENGDAITEAFPLQPGKQGDMKLKVNANFAQTYFEYSVTVTNADIEAVGNSRPGVEIVR